jgi:alpha-L-arabinofuranosidase
MRAPKNNKTQYIDSIPCHLQIQAKSTAPTTTSTTVGVTVISLISVERTWKHKGLFRRDVIKWLKESMPPFLRIPGGNFVEGLQWSGEWNWKQTLGPVENRPGHNNDRWGYFTSDGLGMFEYLLLAEEIGAKPLLVINAGCTMVACVSSNAAMEKYIQDAVDAVEFAMGDPKVTYWGAQRAAAGHASPFDLEALGIGNENCRPLHLPHYAHNWFRVALAVRANNPNLPLVLGCETMEQMQNMLQIEPRIGELGNLMYDIHQRHDPKSFLRNAHYFDTFPRNESKANIKAFVSEYSSPREAFPEGVDLGGAVAEAIYMLGIEANGDAIQLASYGDLFANRHDLDKKEHAASGIPTILLDANASFGTVPATFTYVNLVIECCKAKQ